MLAGCLSTRSHLSHRPEGFTALASISGATIRPCRSGPLRVTAGLGDAIRDLFDFDSWAPRSSQAWRLGQQPVARGGGGSAAAANERITEDDVDVLNERLARARSSEGGRGASVAGSATAVAEEPPSFMGSSDDDLASALSARIGQVASGSGPADASVGSLDGRALRRLIYEKFGKQHDCAFVRRDIPGKTIVALNIYHAHVGQRSYPTSLEEYEEKMDGVAALLEAWGQAGRVEAFLKAPIAPRRGLPSKPIVGNAVSVTLELTPGQIAEWFGR